jgi:AraC-like DNA-binding protein
MINPARHEEYPSSNGEAPFVLNIDIERTPHKVSAEQNWHDELEIELCTEGEGEVLLDGKSYTFREGDVIIVNSGVLHHTGSNGRVVYTCLIPRLALCRTVGLDPTLLYFEPLVQDGELAELIRSLARADKEGGTILFRCELLLRILLILQRRYALPKAKRVETRPHMQSVREAIALIRRDFSKKITLDAIARSVYIDKYTLCREFKRATGQTVIEYVNSYRIQKASHLISGGYTVSEAARTCGFENMSFFTRTFKKHLGCLPSSYRASKSDVR